MSLVSPPVAAEMAAKFASVAPQELRRPWTCSEAWRPEGVRFRSEYEATHDLSPFSCVYRCAAIDMI